MRQWVLWVLCLLLVLCLSAAHAEGLPNVGTCLGTEGQCQMVDYAFSADYHCDVWVYPRSAQTDALIGDWLLQTLEQGYVLSKTTVEGETAYCVVDSSGRYALLFPEFQGVVMLLVQQGMRYCTEPETTVSPETTKAPTTASAPVVSSAVQWEWVTVEKDCPACVAGVCSLCHGTGTYRLYGQAVECPTDCTTCDGKGTYTTTEYRPVGQ